MRIRFSSQVMPTLHFSSKWFTLTISSVERLVMRMQSLCKSYARTSNFLATCTNGTLRMLHPFLKTRLDSGDNRQCMSYCNHSPLLNSKVLCLRLITWMILRSRSILKMLRGVHLTNLVGMEPIVMGTKEMPNAIIARPLLNARKTDIVDFLTLNQLEWREDESNASNKYLRNRVRNELIPLVERHDGWT